MSRRFTTASPAETARAILDALFATRHPPDDRAPGLPAAHTLTPLQHDAVREAEATIRRYGGVLIADSVGMGKTYIGAALARAAHDAGRNTLVVAPTALRRQWNGALRYVRTAAAGSRPQPLRIVSHTDLSRDAVPEPDRPFARVIVDEAHAFRNPDTRRYAALARITRAADVVLLTATPVNNSLLDLYFLIRLFAGDGAFADLGTPDIGRLFRIACLAPDAPATPALAAVLRAITIRRTRADVGAPDLPDNARFPLRAAPHTVHYQPAREFLDWFAHAVHTIEALHLAPYRLDEYGLRRDRAGAAPLLRLLLAKRLESGTAAFRRSIADLATRLTEFLDALGRGLLRPPGQETHHDDGSQLLLEELLFEPLPAHLDVRRLAEDTRADLDRLRVIADRLESTTDPKAAALERLLFDQLDGQPVLVFTEFRDTATDLWRRFRARGGTGLIHGSEAWLGSGAASRNDVIRRFAPRANHAPTPPAHETIRVLFATDVLSEGLNLQDAAHVVSYDLPWNPVRLIQRVGRIDRLGSPHDTVHSHHFLPAAGLEPLLGLVERLRRKLAAIRTGLAASPATTRATDATPREDADPTGDTGETGAANTRSIVERLATGDPTLLDDIERLDAVSLDPTDGLRRLWKKLPPRPDSGRDSRPAGRAKTPLLATIRPDAAPAATTPAALVALEHRGHTLLLETHHDGHARPAGPAATALLEQALATGHTTPATCVGTGQIPETAESHEESHEEGTATDRHIRIATRAALHAASPPPTTTPRTARNHTTRKVLRHLRLAAATTPGGPDPDLCTRIDHITTTLAAGLRAGHEAALQHLLASPPWSTPTTTPAPTLCAHVESALHLAPPTPSPPITPTRPPRPIAIILIK